MMSILRRSATRRTSKLLISSTHIQQNASIAPFFLPSFRSVSSDSSISEIFEAAGGEVPEAGSTATSIAPITDVVDGIATAMTPATIGTAPSHYVMSFIDNMHVLADIPYWQAIVATTIAVRILLIPINIATIRNSARMACMRPHMQKLQDLMNADPNISDIRVKSRYQEEMKQLFVQYHVNPIRSILLPFAQIPIFFTFFFALKDMGTYFPGMSTGGTLWFTDLTAADPTYILPVLNAASFLVMIEIGMDGMPSEQGAQFKWFMRMFSVVMIPLTVSFSQALFVYWAANNSWSIAQVLVLKHELVRKYFDIPKPPPPEDTPDLRLKNPLHNIVELIKKETSTNPNAEAEIIDGVKPPPPPPFSSSSSASDVKERPLTYNTPPRHTK